ncbi:balbiani ring protein 3-like isoform X2 [Coccinella septempunctata]|uniref:balbiani ring protein 3-like isoform X2 n=1 Tax=Coccinella septempunctata TaxID=41139 RepID=UPI001D070BAC|nr:balbiani ring protein 3-like isoform X2 [Coccinella septempunctata]
MKILILILLALFSSIAFGINRKKCLRLKRRRPASFSAPFNIGYQFQRNVFEVPNFSDQNTVLLREPGVTYGLTPRFRSSVANINPMQVSCESSNVTSALKELRQQVKCVPRDGIVNLKAPEGFMVSPNTVMVKKCGGMCNGARSCLSKTTRQAEFFVRSVNFQTNEVVCSSILVPEDTSCVCGCETKMTDCLPTQKYDKNMCVCKCINMQDYQNCVKKSQMNFKWDEKTCSCVCSITKICTTGSHWIPSECRCAKLKN